MTYSIPYTLHRLSRLISFVVSLTRRIYHGRKDVSLKKVEARVLTMRLGVKHHERPSSRKTPPVPDGHPVRPRVLELVNLHIAAPISSSDNRLYSRTMAGCPRPGANYKLVGETVSRVRRAFEGRRNETRLHDGSMIQTVQADYSEHHERIQGVGL
jgi:hypothetical protein